MSFRQRQHLQPKQQQQQQQTMNRADLRPSINIMTLGDEGVGKSSLISTFVSRQFSTTVPGIMSRVQLPPDPRSSCITTIVDSQSGDRAIMEGTMEVVDAIVLVYDLSQEETFRQLEEHWLPLIERVYEGKVPVVVAENKMDLFLSSSSTAVGNNNNDRLLSRKRQQIVALMQRFPFVRQCIKCSAKNAQRVDDVFLKAQQAVIYPFVPPLYDLTTGNMTMECKRALTRIFRIFDKDHDGFLSDPELNRFERDTYSLPIFDRELDKWKKHIAAHNHFPEEVVTVDGKLSVQGFLTMFDVFIGQNRLDLVWQGLRKYNYDDDLNLIIPDYVSCPVDASMSWRLSRSAKRFLSQIFRQFDSDKDGSLSPEDIVSMFSIVAPPCLPPWHPMRAPDLFKDCFSLPKESPAAAGSSAASDQSDFHVDTSLIVPSAMSQSFLSTSGVSLLSASDSLPSIDVGGMHPLSKSLSYLEWMGHWHALSAISPSVTREELYRLGHLEQHGKTKIAESSRRRKKKKAMIDNLANDPVYRDSQLRSREIRVLVLGSRSCGKTSLLNALCGTFDATVDSSPKAIDTKFTSRPETSATFVKMKRKLSATATGEKTLYEEFVVHLVFTEVPEAAAAKQSEHISQLSEIFGASLTSRDRFCDLAMLVFDCTNESSFDYVRNIETSFLLPETPRVFVATRGDLVGTTGGVDESSSVALKNAVAHCLRFDLEPPLVTSAASGELSAGATKRNHVLSHVSLCALRNESGLDKVRAIPHEQQKRRDASRRRNLLWLGGIVSAGVVIAVGVGLFLNTSGKKGGHKGSSAFGWLRSFFGPMKSNVARA